MPKTSTNASNKRNLSIFVPLDFICTFHKCKGARMADCQVISGDRIGIFQKSFILLVLAQSQSRPIPRRPGGLLPIWQPAALPPRQVCHIGTLFLPSWQVCQYGTLFLPSWQVCQYGMLLVDGTILATHARAPLFLW